jgi:hypothetical protein
MSYTLDQLGAMLDSLTTRMAAIDGQGLPEGTQSVQGSLTANVAGLRRDFKQLVGTLQQQLDGVKTQVTGYVAAVKDVTTANSTP